MKKSLLWGAIAALFFASCSKSELNLEPAVEPTADFAATFAQTRTGLQGTAVVWNAEDELSIFTKTEHNRQYRVKSLSEDGRTATFGFVNYTGTSSNVINANYALYPFNADATISGDVISTVIASEQVYNAEKVDLSYALMAAKSEDNNLAFTNAGALIRFNISKSELLPENYTLSSIKLSSAANNLAGDVTIDLSADCKAVVASTGSKEVILSSINKQITTEVQPFYVALPATIFADKDLTVTFTFAEGDMSFALPAFELAQNSIKTIAYNISDQEDFVGTTPDNNDDAENSGTSAANKVIIYRAPQKINTGWDSTTFGANIVSHEYDAATITGTITCDNAITTIGSRAFASVDLLEITLPNSVESIGYEAFRSSWFNAIVIPDGVKSIGDNAFQSTSLKNITIPNSVNSIGNYAFSNCTNLTTVTIGSGLTSSGANPFCGCSSLVEFLGEFVDESGVHFIVDSTLVSVAEGAGLSGQYTVPQGITAIGQSAVSGQSGITSVIIPDSVTSIGAGAFESNYDLESVTFGNGVKTVGDAAFKNAAITTVNIPDSVTSIGESAFSSCRLTEVYIGRGVESIGMDAFNYNNALKYVYCKASVPPTAGDYMFGVANSDVVIYVPFGCANAYNSDDGWNGWLIENRLFDIPANNEIWYTTYNNKVVTPKDVFNSTIKSNTYENGKGVIIFNDNLTTIGYEAFKSCLTMENIVIPKSVTLLDGDAFYGCSSLYNVYCTPTTPPNCRYGAFPDVSTIYVPTASVDTYKSAGEYWNYYTSDIVGYDFE